jgi:hypothetical protein
MNFRSGCSTELGRTAGRNAPRVPRQPGSASTRGTVLFLNIPAVNLPVIPSNRRWVASNGRPGHPTTSNLYR